MAKRRRKISPKVNAVLWYADNRAIYEKLSVKVESIIQELLIDNKILVHAVHCRTKALDSFEKKIQNDRYTDPKNQITDLSGIRIIAYVESDLVRISRLIEDNFEIDPENSVDKSTSLGVDQVGYRSIHYVGKLQRNRIELAEYKKYNGLKFEIQLRTILQHAWAEIGHDKDYKFSGVLPTEIQRRFRVLSGVLELVDREFNELAKEIDSYSEYVNVGIKKGKLDIQLNSTSLKSFMNARFIDMIRKGQVFSFSNDENERVILAELDDFGVRYLSDLNRIFPQNFKENLVKYQLLSPNRSLNFNGILRDIMMINDAEKYFIKSFKDHWRGIDISSINMLEVYNKNIRKILNKYGVDILPDEIVFDQE